MEKIKKTIITERNAARTSLKETRTKYDMIVFCHLRWDFVYQRPQHIISRLSKDLKILFVEEPLGKFDYENNTCTIENISDNLHICKPNCNTIEEIAPLLKQIIGGKHAPIAWFYSAAFCPVLVVLDFDTIVYDCMDELSMFKGASEQLLVQEKFLLSCASIVFTGGKSLYDSKKMLHSNVHCFPSSVDEKHFATATQNIKKPQDLILIDAPIVGYYGIIDERIDLTLIFETAKNLPNVSFVMIGPLAKISEGDLPRLNNIHYLGMKSYDVLPSYLKHFDIAMMPFALNDATKYISPTKTLEYIAAQKPVISTAIKDVIRDYKDVVTIISDENDFTSAVNTILDGSTKVDHSKYTQILTDTSWDSTVKAMIINLNKFV